MPTIDQRILIPAPPDAVWAYLSDIRKNPEWQEDCRGVSFLSQSQQGPGTRWRSTLPKGHDAIIQVTAWYKGLGYEYTYIDGMPYKQSSGRIRLQEIPEGTIVQWTFNFEGGGLGVRGAARSIEKTMADSLRELHKRLQSAAQKRELEAKSLMRDDPGVQARATYKPRHPSAVENKESVPGTDTQPKPRVSVSYEPPINDEDNQPIPVLNSLAEAEPPVVLDDTRPRPPMQIGVDQPSEAPSRYSRREPQAPVVPFDEPDFLDDLDKEQQRFGAPPPAVEIAEPQVESTDTKPVRAAKVEASETSAEQVEAAQYAESDDSPYEAIEMRPASYAPMDELQPIDVDIAASISEIIHEEEEAPASSTKTQPVEQQDSQKAASAEKPVKAAFVIPEPARDLTDDTASIWDVFGLQRPSETQEMRAVAAKRAAAFGTPDDEEKSFPPRMGMRLGMRQRRVKLRRSQV
jgi:hypothetical protein